MKFKFTILILIDSNYNKIIFLILTLSSELLNYYMLSFKIFFLNLIIFCCICIDEQHFIYKFLINL